MAGRKRAGSCRRPHRLSSKFRGGDTIRKGTRVPAHGKLSRKVSVRVGSAARREKSTVEGEVGAAIGAVKLGNQRLLSWLIMVHGFRS
jgi:hypothetical protein